MSHINIPEAFQYATDIIAFAHGDWEPFIHKFLQRWPDLTPQTLAHILHIQPEYEEDTLFALCALGHLEFPDVTSLLRPFIHSSNRTERWISILSLGHHREPTVFLLLLSLLLEDLCHLNMVPEETSYDYDWYLVLRYEAAHVLGAWGHPSAIETICEAIRQCRTLQLHPDEYSDMRPAHLGYPQKPPYPLDTYDSWIGTYNYYLNVLTFTLGQLKARDALSALSLPPAYWRFAQIYYLFGTLHTSSSQSHPNFGRIPVQKRLNGSLEVIYMTNTQVLQAFEIHFQASQEAQEIFLSEVLRASEQRRYECYPRNTPGYEKLFVEVDYGLDPF